MTMFKKPNKPEGVIVTEKAQLDVNTPSPSETNPGVKDYGGLSRDLPQASEEGHSKVVQAGVLKIEASTTVWSKTHLILAYVMYVFWTIIILLI